jgi:hypothetical protein
MTNNGVDARTNFVSYSIQEKNLQAPSLDHIFSEFVQPQNTWSQGCLRAFDGVASSSKNLRSIIFNAGTYSLRNLLLPTGFMSFVQSLRDFPPGISVFCILFGGVFRWIAWASTVNLFDCHLRPLYFPNLPPFFRNTHYYYPSSRRGNQGIRHGRRRRQPPPQAEPETELDILTSIL